MHHQPRQKPVQFPATRWAVGVLLVGAAQLPAIAMSESTPPAIVGEATMVIGMARITNALGQSVVADKGAAIRVGDRIETEAGGHVHLRFVDGGRVSVRPASRLQIESYSHSSDKPALSAIKFRLDDGVVRSITGTWGEAARDRFRLNTPMAAIGVKGTDFIVKSAPGTTSVSVYTGAVLLAPLAGGCQATLGPCLNGGEKLLSEDMKGQMLELNRQHASAQLVPAEGLAQSRKTVVASGEGGHASKNLHADAAPYGDIGADKAMVSESRVAIAVTTKPPQTGQLVWGRWAAPMEGDNFSKTFEEARLNRESTVGNGAYGLFREPPVDATAVGGTGVVGVSPAQAEGVANFRLVAGAAKHLTDGALNAQAARIDNGSLSVDFTRSTFATQLNVSGPALGVESVRATGVVLSSGVMQSRTGDAFVAGALSNDRKEAGYFFEKAVPSGSLTGITLWGR